MKIFLIITSLFSTLCAAASVVAGISQMLPPFIAIAGFLIGITGVIGSVESLKELP